MSYLLSLDKKLGQIIEYALKKGIQINPNALAILEKIDASELEQLIKELIKEKIKQHLFQITQKDLEEFLGLDEDKSIENDHKILVDPTDKITSAEGIAGYNALFADRFSKLKKIILDRPESKMLKSISAVMTTTTKPKDGFYIGGLVTERTSDKNAIKLVLDDPTGAVEVMVFEDDLKKNAEVLLLDQFIMVKITPNKNGINVVKDIILPDVPDRAATRSKTEAHAVFLSDLHVGNKHFMEKEFNEFIRWLNSSDPVSRKVKFVLIAGDVVDGIGIYPNQDKELVCPTLESQLEKLDQILSQIPKHIKIFMITGNHDPGRRALPQPALPKKYNPDLWNRENIHLLGNPSMVSLNGVKVLMFHGQSIDDIVKTTPGLAYDQPAKVMKHLVRARHMGPVYGSQTPIAPEVQDMMIIDEVPEIFHTGHVHIVGLDIYRSTLLINSGAWQAQTDFQASVGIMPTPGVAIVVNLKTFKVYYKDFKNELL